MTRKTVGYVELVWTCPRCGTKNPGPQKFCNGCGAPQPKDVEFEQAAEEKLLTDAAAIARAKAGPDIHCPYCGARNPATAKFCGSCGGNLAGGAARDQGRVLGAHRAGPAPKVKCPACGTENSADAGRCSNCGNPLPREAAKPADAAPPGAGRRIPPAAAIGVGVCVLLAVVAGALALGRRTQTEASVASVHWERTIAVEALRPVEHEDWRDQIPSDATVGTCRQEVRRTQDDPAPNSIEVCGTPYTVDLGNGEGEVVQDCEYQVYDDLCSYTATEWTSVDRLVASGDALSPDWPSASLQSDERLGARQESYSVVFDAADRNYTYSPPSETEFLRFDVGSRWILEVNALGGVLSVEPAS
jgi:membrane protease subunit (stomatin/prohibitin family)